MIVLWLLLAALAFTAPAHAATCGTADDTASIQAHLDANDQTSLPPGRCYVSRLNMTNRRSPVLRGSGVLGGTVLLPIEAGAVVIDLTGSDGARLEDFQLGEHGWPIVPQVGILIAQPYGAEPSNLHTFSRIHVTGRYVAATLYVYGVPSSSIIGRSSFWNFDPNAPVAIFTSLNVWAIQSPWTRIAEGLHYAADWDLIGVEWHHNIPSGRSTQPTLVCYGCSSLRFLGGAVAGAGPFLLGFMSSPGATNAFLDFVGVAFYSDNGTPAGGVFSGPATSVNVFGGSTNTQWWI